MKSGIGKKSRRVQPTDLMGPIPEPQGRVERILLLWARALIRSQRKVLWVSLALVVVSGVIAGTRLVVRNSTMDLIRKESPVF